MIFIKTKEEIQILREGGRILSKILREVVEGVKPGITTSELNKVARDLVFRFGAEPSFEGYQNFPAVLCTSINEEIVHGIPGKRKLKEGDIIGLDLGIKYKGLYTDKAVTVPVGKISAEAGRLLVITKKALRLGIKEVKPGNQIGDISSAIQSFVESEGFNVVRDLVGHGVGRKVHEPPEIPNYGEKGEGLELKEGMVLAIEPMVVEGNWHIRRLEKNGAFATRDKSLSAHFEETVAVIERGAQVLTK